MVDRSCDSVVSVKSEKSTPPTANLASLLFALDSRSVFVFLAKRFLEAANAEAQAAPDLRNPIGSEEQHDQETDEQEFRRSESTARHGKPFCKRIQPEGVAMPSGCQARFGFR